MAAEQSKDNPFSFKAFVNKREQSRHEPPKRKEGATKKKTSAGTQPNEAKPFPEAPGENPFSFKNFMKKTEKPTITAAAVQSDDSSFSSDEDSPKMGPPLFPDPLEVPAVTKKTHQTVPEPVKDIFDSSSSENDEFGVGPPGLHKLPLPDPLIINPPGEDQEEEGGELLDINPFPEVAMLASDETQQQMVLELKKVKSENELLKKQVSELEKNLKKEKGKSQSLKEELKTLKEKEERDTKALEDMIQKVEDNLRTATQRAVNADATILKLKTQVQTLQTQLGQANPQAIHKSYEDLVTGVREKANYASQQLKAAVHKADLQIKDLCQGIETLKLVSDVLENIDSIYEVK